MPGLIDCHAHVYADSVKQIVPEPPATYRVQYAQKYLRHASSCGFTSVRDVAGGDHGMGAFTGCLGDFIVGRLAPAEFALTKELVEIEVRDYVKGVDRRDARYPLQVRIYGNNFPSRKTNLDGRLELIRSDLDRFINKRVGMSL